MGQHRAAPARPDAPADPSAYVGRRVATPAADAGRAERTSSTTSSSPAATTDGASSYVGRRVARPAAERLETTAAERARLDAVVAALEPRDQTTSFDGESTVTLPLPATAHSGSGSGSRTGARTGNRRGPLRLLPSAPLAGGVAALALAAVGALSTHAQPVLASAHEAATSSVLTDLSGTGTGSASSSDGTDSGSSSGEGIVRPPVVSRDSSREALAEMAKPKLVKAAEAQMQQRNAKLAGLAAQAQNYADKLKLSQWVLPVVGYHLTATFGESSGLWSTVHTGLDFAAPSGTPIVSIASGTVTSTGYDGSYGNKTVITLDDGTELWYCHQTSIGVSPGETVSAGQTIGTVGSTGNTTGPHLHLEVRPGGGDPVDPYAALVAHGLHP